MPSAQKRGENTFHTLASASAVVRQEDAKALGEVIKSGADDAAIGSYVRAHARGEQGAFRDSLSTPSRNPILILALYVMRRSLRKRLGATRPDIDWSRVDSIAKLLAVEEGHP